MISFEKKSCQQKFKFKQKYLGETEQSMKDKIWKHLGYTRYKNKTQATGYYFDILGHGRNNLYKKNYKGPLLQNGNVIISYYQL